MSSMGDRIGAVVGGLLEALGRVGPLDEFGDGIDRDLERSGGDPAQARSNDDPPSWPAA